MRDRRLYAPATLRNRDPILAVLRDTLPATGSVLEIASGSGEHAVYFAGLLPALTFQPTDPGPDALASIADWTRAEGLANVRPPLMLDVRETPWPVVSADAILCINMIHIAPWTATEGLMRGAGAILPAGAPLYLYGPFRRGGRHTAPGNEDFDDSLRERDPRWGVRDLEAVAALAASAGFLAPAVIQMPANNLSVVFRKA